MKTERFLDAVESERVVSAIRAAEARSSGEIRVHVSRQPGADVEPAAARQFEKLGMTQTRERNGILIYIVPSLRKFAVIGDRGIHEKCGADRWRGIAEAMAEDFRSGRFTEGIVHGVTAAGDLLAAHFPRSTDRPDVNELPDQVSED
jgi:uncharacterized membrane protein